MNNARLIHIFENDVVELTEQLVESRSEVKLEFFVVITEKAKPFRVLTSAGDYRTVVDLLFFIFYFFLPIR